ncbi:SRPBCC domain-containing protein [Mesorhizobium sp. 2RAF45]|uniref:SRPBCC domain-containing protein n=1 Tax=Mesorhizobium sp. 2RAF45 TaxID=3233001 RepID=UPI003F96035B
MATTETPRARASIIIRVAPDDITKALIEPDRLTQFWLASSSAPLAAGAKVHWKFMVPSAEVDTTATRLIPGRKIDWKWSDGTNVNIDLEEVDGGTAVTIVSSGFRGSKDEAVEHALTATEGFAFVLAALKDVLESGKASNIVRDKARLIELRR